MTRTQTASIAEFFDEELAPLVRRMADRPRAESGPGDEDRREIREMVWQGLMGLGALDTSDTVRLAEVLGSVLYQGPLLDTITARELFPDNDLGQAPVALAVSTDTWSTGDDVITARRTFVGFAAEVEYFVVGGVDAAGMRLALVRAGDPSITMRRYEETGRGEEYEVEFAGTPVAAWADSFTGWETALANARIRQAAYLVGLTQAALDHAVDYAKTRRQFGQPVGKFQGVAFRLSELSMHIDATRMLVHDHDATTHAAANLAAAADLARTATTQTMQVNGAVGMQSDNDAQLYYRRAAIESVRLGTPAQLRRESWA
ncbi:alkylation response protein AidB-like acyl-CoA dehydrogenase [Kibdelosporangium banguiense]|uniref:Alkylation response protein AidB-like acyl-CoA dehydrogenase n=1 Tax=Kibdelosporangium banguiense TaxID=1365924 RepID=A0ABS4TXB9_9PSEU|nr:acyl-CoA dehydrogenase family protein [Kibdelosporangium banguiense]MBP2329029.1 alkylation response protein AidB-like acyl-CoA dehydrogenase [Kibdelosporangium banguiense]